MHRYLGSRCLHLCPRRRRLLSRGLSPRWRRRWRSGLPTHNLGDQGPEESRSKEVRPARVWVNCREISETWSFPWVFCMNFYSYVLHPEAQSGCANPDPHEGREESHGFVGRGCGSPDSLGWCRLGCSPTGGRDGVVNSNLHANRFYLFHYSFNIILY